MKSFMIKTRYILPLFTNTWLGIFVPATVKEWISERNVSRTEKNVRSIQSESFRVIHPAESNSSRNTDCSPKP